MDKALTSGKHSSLDDEKTSVASISKGIAILRLLGSADLPLTITEIARQTKLTPSSCHDLVTTLVQIGFVQPNAIGKSYQIGARMLRLAKLALMPPGNFLEIQRSMNLIADRYDISLSVLRAFGMSHYISTLVSDGGAPIRIRLSAGQKYPLLRGATGKFFAAYGNPGREGYLDRLADINVSSSKDIKRFDAEVAEAKARGWAVDRAKAQRGVATIAVPILTAKGHFLGAVESAMFEKKFEQASIKSIVQDTKNLSSILADGLVSN